MNVLFRAVFLPTIGPAKVFLTPIFYSIIHLSLFRYLSNGIKLVTLPPKILLQSGSMSPHTRALGRLGTLSGFAVSDEDHQANHFTPIDEFHWQELTLFTDWLKDVPFPV